MAFDTETENRNVAEGLVERIGSEIRDGIYGRVTPFNPEGAQAALADTGVFVEDVD